MIEWMSLGRVAAASELNPRLVEGFEAAYNLDHEAALANTFGNFSAYFERVLEELFIERMDGNEEIFNRVMSDTSFRGAAHDHVARQVWERVRARHEAEAREGGGRRCRRCSRSGDRRHHG